MLGATRRCAWPDSNRRGRAWLRLRLTTGVLLARFVVVIGRSALFGLCLALAPNCDRTTVSPDDAGPELREGQPLGSLEATSLYSPKFVIRGMAADGQHLYVSGLRYGKNEDESLPTGVIVKLSLLGVPETLAEGEFIPMATLQLIDGRLYWHERHDSPDGRGLRSLSIDGGEVERVSDMSGQSWVIRPDVVYFTRPDDEIDYGGFYQLERNGKAKPKLVARRRGVVRTLLGEPSGEALYWTTRARADRSWAVFEWDGDKSGNEILRSDETFASLILHDEHFLWVTWAERDGQAWHSLYRRPVAGGEIEVLASKQGMPGFMEVFADEQHIYVTTVSGGELRRLPASGGELEVLTGSGDRNPVANRFNLFWVEDQQVHWMRK